MNSKKILIIAAISLIGITLAVVVFKQIKTTSSTSDNIHSELGHDNDRDHNKEGDHELEGDEHSEEKVVRLNEQEMKEFGIEVGKAGHGKLQIHVSLPGEITVNADRLAHIVPRVSGVVREVRKTIGDPVRKGEVVAVLESRELADAKAAFLAALERVALASANFNREEGLYKKKISSEQEYLEAKQAIAEVRIELRSAEQKLHALGFSEDSLSKLPDQPEVSFTRYEITAPFDGTVIEKHITLGEVLKDDAEAYVIVDLSSVWVNLSVYQKDLPFVQKGQPVVISAGHGIPDVRGRISYVGPLVDEETRTTLARVILPNTDGRWRPGLFITALVTVDAIDVSVAVPKTALQMIEDKTHVFIETEDGFEPRAVTVGRANETNIEITSGITAGQRYVTKGAFTLKAQLSKGAFGDGHGGH